MKQTYWKKGVHDFAIVTVNKIACEVNMPDNYDHLEVHCKAIKIKDKNIFISI